jgi:hypothetical protein
MSNNQFIDDFFQKKNDNILSLTTNCVRISENIININPVPMYIKPKINNCDLINIEFNIIASTLDEQNLYIDKNQDPSKSVNIFTSQNAYVPLNNILTLGNNVYIKEILSIILDGINELVSRVYNFNGTYKYTIANSWIQKYKNGNFLSAHNHLTSTSAKNDKVFSVAYYIDDGDPDTTQSYSGCITFLNNNNLFHLRPQTGTLLIWEDYLVHLVNPFYSKSNKERFVLSANVMVSL